MLHGIQHITEKCGVLFALQYNLEFPFPRYLICDYFPNILIRKDKKVIMNHFNTCNMIEIKSNLVAIQN